MLDQRLGPVDPRHGEGSTVDQFSLDWFLPFFRRIPQVRVTSMPFRNEKWDDRCKPEFSELPFANGTPCLIVGDA